MVEALREQGVQAAEAAKARLAVAQIEAEDADKQRAHELLVLKEETRLEEEELKAVNAHRQGREWTLRILGGAVLLGMFVFLFYALYKQENMDVRDTLQTFGALLAFLYLLVERTLPRGAPSK